MEITLSKVVEAARQRRAAVTAEVGGYVVWLAAQRLAASPCQVAAELIGLSAAGELLLAASVPAEPLETEQGLRRLLGSLLSLCHSAPPGLKAAGERTAAGDLGALVAELQSALIPINHAASVRALARLFRETQRALRPLASVEPGAPEASAATAAARTAGSETPPSQMTPVPAASVRAPQSSSAAAQTLMPAAQTLMPAAQTLMPAAQTLMPAAQTLPDSSATAAPAIATVAPPVVAELEIDVDIVLADTSEAESELDAAWDDVEVRVEELEVEQDDIDRLLGADVAETTPVPADCAELAPEGEDSNSADLAESPLPDSSVIARCSDSNPPPQRSDLRDLLNGYLAHTRCEEQMTADLRRMIGLEPGRAHARQESPKLGP